MKLVKDADVFKLKIGDKVYDHASKKFGKVSTIKETAYEWIEAFVLLDGEEKAVVAASLPEAELL